MKTLTEQQIQKRLEANNRTAVEAAELLTRAGHPQPPILCTRELAIRSLCYPESNCPIAESCA